MADKLRIMRKKENGPATRTAVGPSHEFGPVGGWQAEQLAYDGKREPSRIAIDQIGGTSIGKEVGGELIGNLLDARLHFENGAPAKCLIDNAP
jgi:hypothetical protein